MELKFNVDSKINKPVSVAFESVVDAEKLSSYFTKTSSGPLVEGATVFWTWNFSSVELAVNVKKVEKDKEIVFEWPSHEADVMTEVRITFEPLSASCTLMTIYENGWRADQKGLNNSYDNCQGWQHMASCMKARLEHGIDLRHRDL